jgi:hypothetical protein
MSLSAHRNFESPETSDQAETSINTQSGRNITFCIGK